MPERDVHGVARPLGQRDAAHVRARGIPFGRVDVDGDWQVPGVDDATIRKMTLAFFEEAFNEDNAALKKYK